MFEKFEILIIIVIILLIFYFVIAWGSGKKRNVAQSEEIKRYLFGVRVLIGLIGIVSLILWFFM
tara:strand:+ start:480 stop:671 length:192 start_codon:yes stop_codon:yes gene_type:complete